MPPALSLPTLILSFGTLYTAQGVIGSIVQSALPVVLRDQGVGLDQIGWLGVLFLPWVVKFLWAPLIDRFSWPRLGHRRGWILIAQGGTSLVALALIGLSPSPTSTLTGLGVALMIAMILAATQDTATDGLAVTLLNPDQRRLGGAVQIAGGYLGLLAGVGLWLPLYHYAGWSAAMVLTAGLCLLALVLVAFSLPADHLPSPASAGIGLIAALKRPLIRRGLLFILIYQIGSRQGVAMIGPFLVDAGLGVDQIGLVKGTLGPALGFLGALLGGIWLKRLEPTLALILFALLHAVIYGGLALCVWADWHDPWLIGGLAALEAFGFALIFVALYSAMLGWCHPGRAGTDFALLQSADALLAVLASILAGQIGQHFGHGVNFALSAALLLLAAPLVPRLLPRPR